jgi:hypothetical protein
VTDTAPRLTVITPDGEFPVGDPRAAEALAKYVRTKKSRELDPEKIDLLNAALVVIPQDGMCAACRRRLPLFLYRCEHWEHWGFSHAHGFWLCTRDRSRAVVLDEDGRDACEELPILVDLDDFDPFAPPPRTALERAFAAGPIAGPVRTAHAEGN